MRDERVIPFPVARTRASEKEADRFQTLVSLIALAALLAAAGALVRLVAGLLEPVGHWAVSLMPKLAPAWEAAARLL